MADLLGQTDLPARFTYPLEFVRAVELGLVNLEPWWILTGQELRERFSRLRRLYPTKEYVPFAHRQDNDDVACWQTAPPEVVIVHDGASSGWEHRGGRGFPNFHAWLRAAVDDFVEWGDLEVKYAAEQSGGPS